MSNTRHLPEPRGDMGIGLCYNCVLQLAAGNLDRMPGFGQTMAPVPVPIGGGVAVVAVPACWDCLTEAAGQSQRKPLLIASGAMK